MSEMEKILQNWDTADEYLNSKIEEVKDVDVLTSIVANSKVSVMNSKSIEINGTGKAIEKLVLEGKTEQNGTPSPSNPVEVKGIGDKVENLWSIGDIVGGNTETGLSLVLSQGTYTISSSTKFGNGISIRFILDDSKSTLITIPANSQSNTFTINHSCKTVNINSTSGTLNLKDVMLVKGTYSEDYIPYGSPKYKIPISCGDTTKNVYLDAPLFDGEKADIVSGMADKKDNVILTMDGTENIEINNRSSDKVCIQYLFRDLPSGVSRHNATCSHFVNSGSTTPQSGAVKTFGFNKSIIYSSYCYFNIPLSVLNITTSTSDADALVSAKNYFKTQFESGNPVIVVTLNTSKNIKETFEGIEIPTTIGKNTLTIGTEVTPTSIEVTTYGDYYSKAEVDKKIAETKEIAGGDLVWFYLDTNKQALQLYEGNKRDTCFFPVISSYMERGGEAYPVTGGILRLYTLDSLNYYAQIQGVERNCTSQPTVISTHMTFKFTPNAKLLLGIPKPCIEEFGISIVNI